MFLSYWRFDMIDAKTLLVILVLIALIVLIVFAIVLIKKLLGTLDRANKVLDDVSVVSEIAAERSQDINGIVENVSGSVSEISGALKGNSGTISAVAGIAKSLASLKGAADKKNKED